MLKIFNSYLKFILFFVFCCTATDSYARKTASIVLDVETGKTLSAKNSEDLMYPASLTKVMTLYITFDALDKGLIKMDDKLPVSRNATLVSPSKLGLRKGETITVENAIKALIVKSANDCAVVLAEALGHSEGRFAEAMTDVAHGLGMKQTTFKNASGLPNKQQKTTAKDMAILAAAMYHHFPQYYDLFSLKKFKYHNVTYLTHNHLLGRFRGADGLKTGYTAAAGFNIVTSAERNGKRIIAVTMGHRTLRERDNFIAQQMEINLKKLGGIKERKTLLAEIEISRKPFHGPSSILEKKEEVIISKNDIKQETKEEIKKELKEELKEETEELSNKNDWGIFVGTFSNYTKAQNYAKKFREKEKLVDKSIEIEIEEVRAAIIYKSKIVGFSKEDADKLCNNLKKTQKSCSVIAGKEIHLAYHNK
ncbi:MAG: D-alanyl-D-alanine carboxypeptidase family protein [Alphaproteobacteria bacterium]